MNINFVLAAISWSLLIAAAICASIYFRRKYFNLKLDADRLLENQGLLRLMMENSSIGTAVVAPDGHWLRANPALTRILGYTEAELQKLTFRDITHPDDLAYSSGIKEKMMSGEMTKIELEKRYIHKNGHPVSTLVYAMPVRDSDGNLKYFINQTVDISGRRKIEQEREQLISELTRANNELERFAFIASHDLQEPLRTICSFADVIGQEYDNQIGDNGRHYLSIIKDAGQRMHELVRDLLDYARAGQHEETAVVFNAAEALNAATRNLLQKITMTDTRIIAGPLPSLKANQTQFTTLLQNLIDNAIKYQKPGNRPEISIDALSSNGGWLFTLRDNGIGLRPEYARQIFEPFKRLHQDDQYQGTGMGLAICRKIIENMGGEIWAESEPDQGCIFRFTVPKR